MTDLFYVLKHLQHLPLSVTHCYWCLEGCIFPEKSDHWRSFFWVGAVLLRLLFKCQCDLVSLIFASIAVGVGHEILAINLINFYLLLVWGQKRTILNPPFMGSILRASVACGACGFQAIPQKHEHKHKHDCREIVRWRSPSHLLVCALLHIQFDTFLLISTFNFDEILKQIGEASLPVLKSACGSLTGSFQHRIEVATLIYYVSDPPLPTRLTLGGCGGLKEP